MGPLTATSIARVQRMASQLQPEAAPEESSLFSAADLEDLEAIKTLQRPLISEPLGAQSLRPEAPLRLFIRDGKVAFGGFRQGDARAPQSLAALIYAAHDMDVHERAPSPVLDLLV